MKKKIFVFLAVFLLAILFLYAAISKLWVYNSFIYQLQQSPFISTYASFLAWSIPLIEIVIAALLVYYRTRLIGLYSSFFLMAAFTIYIYLMLYFSTNQPCSCGGIMESMGWKAHLYFNVGFTLLAGIAVYLSPPTSKHSKQFN